MRDRERAELLSNMSECPQMCISRFFCRFLQRYRGCSIRYLCTVAALRVVVVLGGQLAVCVFIRGYAVIVMLVIINTQVQCVWQRKKCAYVLLFLENTACSDRWDCWLISDSFLSNLFQRRSPCRSLLQVVSKSNFFSGKNTQPGPAQI